MATSRKIEDIRLEVYQLMAEENRELAERFLASAPASPYVEEQLVMINRYWRSELGRLSINTISERECLIDKIDPSDWLRHFRNQVLPTIIRFNLPA